MKNNYKAWDVDYQLFYGQRTLAEQLGFLIKFAVLAPSSHNSQPWKLSVRENKISIMPDFNRRLAASDQNDRQLYISLGCCLENILTAADYYGFKTSVQYQMDNNDVLEISISFGQLPADNRSDKHNIFCIARRRTNRRKYENYLPEEFLNSIKNYSASDINVNIVCEQKLKNQIADTVISAIQSAMNDKAFRKELSSYVKPNFTSSPFGMPGSGFGMPAPFSVIAPYVMRHFNINKITSKQDKRLLAEFTPAMAIISTKNDNAESWIKAGQMYEKIALEAENNNINTHVMAAAIQIGDYYQNLQKITGSAFRPQVFFRVGRSLNAAPRSPRLNETEVIKS